MPKTSRQTHAEIVAAADTLFYRHGFGQTSFAHIADAVQLSRGNFYYHFKSKDEILEAVIRKRIKQTQDMLDAWTTSNATPRDRIRDFIHILLRNKDPIQQHGCPVGTLSIELAKLDHAAKFKAVVLFRMFRVWLRSQFEELGCGAGSDALAMHLLVRSQGVATLANAFHDEAFIKREVDMMCEWLDQQIPGQGEAS